MPNNIALYASGETVAICKRLQIIFQPTTPRKIIVIYSCAIELAALQISPPHVECDTTLLSTLVRLTLSPILQEASKWYIRSHFRSSHFSHRAAKVRDIKKIAISITRESHSTLRWELTFAICKSNRNFKIFPIRGGESIRLPIKIET